MEDQLQDYLWDGKGEPDPEVARLEQTLSQLRSERPLRPLPERHHVGWRWAIAVLAPVAAVAAMLLVVIYRPDAVRRLLQPRGDWQVIAVAGSPRIDGATDSRELGAGQVLVTDGNSQAEIHVGRMGRVQVMPNSRVRLTETRNRRHRISLEQGSIAVRMWAPPFDFVVDTASASAYDIGCAYSMHVDKRGAGSLSVTSGWVEVELDYAQVMVPAGATTELLPSYEPLTPYFDDAEPALKDALRRLEFGASDPVSRAAALQDLLVAARHRHDAYTLILLMRRLDHQERAVVLDRAAELLPLPPGVTRQGILDNDPTMSGLWTQSLGLGEAKRWWVNWRDMF